MDIDIVNNQTQEENNKDALEIVHLGQRHLTSEASAVEVTLTEHS